MQETTYSRKLEKNGRLMIPIELRKQMGMEASKEYKFFTMIKDGHKFICVDCGPEITDKAIEEAMKLLQEKGMKIVQSDN